MVAMNSGLPLHFYWPPVLLSLIIGILGLLTVVVNGQANTSGLPAASPGGTSVHRRFEYKYSFKPPYLAQRDGTVPFWEYGGNAIASRERVRVAPSLRSQKGAIWTKLQTTFEWWEVDIVFRITGRGRVGADGLAFWYTTQKGDYNGPVFGSSDRWNGLAIFFDSFDNDNKHNNPYIMAMLNDGTKQFEHQNDASNQLLSGCLRDFRNKPYPTRARIEYYNNILTVMFHNGNTNNYADYELCMRVEVVLPKFGYFGLSAATGGLADDHDVFHFLTVSLHPPGQMGVVEKPTSDESEKLSKEFREYQEKLEKQKEEYKREHPDQPKDDDDWDDVFESETQREARQNWESQAQIFEQIREISRKIDEVIGRQENTLSLVSRSLSPAAAGGAAPPVSDGQGAPAIGGGAALPAITRSEVDIMISNQNTLMTSVREMRSLVGDINVRVDNVLQGQQRSNGHVQGQGQAHAIGYDMQSLVNEMRDGINQVKQGLSHVGQKIGAPATATQVSCPSSNCLGVTLFLSVTIVQLLLVCLYTFVKGRSEAQAKKFY